jgi:hypothetical protein
MFSISLVYRSFRLVQLLESGVQDEKALEFIQFTDDWLAELEKSFTKLHKESAKRLKQV